MRPVTCNQAGAVNLLSNSSRNSSKQFNAKQILNTIFFTGANGTF
jgi:hypothetical protein